MSLTLLLVLVIAAPAIYWSVILLGLVAYLGAIKVCDALTWLLGGEVAS